MLTARSVQEVVASVCRTASEFHRRGNISILHLVEDSNYRANQTAVSVAEIRRHLQANPELVGEWHMYSENKRTSSGWHFDATARRVGYYVGSRREHEQAFADVSEACAAFIKYEMDSIVAPAA